MQEQEFQRASACDADMMVALALAAECDMDIAAQAAGMCEDDSAQVAREMALSDAISAAMVAADAALALRLSFEEPDEVDADEVRDEQRGMRRELTLGCRTITWPALPLPLPLLLPRPTRYRLPAMRTPQRSAPRVAARALPRGVSASALSASRCVSGCARACAAICVLMSCNVFACMQAFPAAALVSAHVVDNDAASSTGEVGMRSCGHGMCGECLSNFVKVRVRQPLA